MEKSGKMAEWQTQCLSELVNISSSKRIFYEDYVESGVPFYRSKEVIEKHQGKEISTDLYISIEKFENIKKNTGVPEMGDMLLTSVGTLGIPYIVKKNEEFYFKDGNLTWFREFSNEFLNCFFYYWLISPSGKEELDNITIGSTQPALTIRGLKGIAIKLPSLPEQKAIASVLSSLDDKIDLLQRQNKTLEAMAETLFRQWFVEEAEDDWAEGVLGDLVEVKYGKDHKKLLDGSIPVYGSGGIMRYAEKALYQNESVLIPRKGTLNNVIYIKKAFWTVDTMFYTIMKKSNLAKFIYLFIKGKDLASMNVGSAVPSMTTQVLNSMPIKIPSENELEYFENLVSPSFVKIESNQKQIKLLEKLRDTLLPKLMSGEVKVKQ